MTEGFAGTLYSFRRCPYAMRARMLLALSGYTIELREVLLRAKPACMLALSAKGTVPVLQLSDGTVLDESIDIIDWVLDAPDQLELRKKWAPDHERTSGRALLARIDGAFKTHLDRYKYSTRYGNVDVEHERGCALAELQPLRDRLAATPMLLGEHPQWVDLATFPFIRQFAKVEAERFAAEEPDLDRWYQALEASALFRSIMIKRPVWQPGDQPRALLE